ncbi:MAG: hypothetical protein PHC70_00350 [Patescibacteria group bacterium]|nr:hypothetical protein [Patescibacteria group bacterium]
MSTKKTALSQAEQRELYAREGWFLSNNLGQLREWLDSQKSAPKPDLLRWRMATKTSPLLNRISLDAQERGWGSVLRDVAEPIKDSDEAYQEYFQLLPGHVKWFAERLVPSVVSFNIADHDRMAYVDLADVVVAQMDLVDDEVTIFPVREDDLLDAALTSWSRQGDRTERARQTCCAWMQSALELLESKARESFDSAVAVAPSGQRVLNADYVVVYSRDSKKKLGFHAFRPATFQRHKVRLGALHVVKPPMPNKKRTDDELFAWVMKSLAKKSIQEGLASNRPQIFIQIGLLRILFIDKVSIPDELRALLASTAPAPPDESDKTVHSPPPEMEPDLRAPAPPRPAFTPTLPSAVGPSLPPAQAIPPPGGIPST